MFLSPDPDSRDGTSGERVEVVPGGWLVLNHANYRDKQTRQQAQTAIRVARHRAKIGVTRNDVTLGNDKKLVSASASASASASEKQKAGAIERPEDVSQEVWDSWMVVRKSKRAKLTTVAMAAMRREADRAGWTLEAAIRECAERNWQAFKADWISHRPKPFQARSTADYVAANSHIQNTPLARSCASATSASSSVRSAASAASEQKHDQPYPLGTVSAVHAGRPCVFRRRTPRP